MMKNVKHGLKLSIGIALSAIFMYLAFRKVDFNQMLNAFKEIKFVYIVLIIGVILFQDWLRALRWQYFLLPIKKVNIGNLFSALIIGYSANTIFPAHLGEFLRAYVVGKKQKIPASSAFASIVTERIVDMFSFLLLMILTLIFFPFPDWVQKSGYIMFISTALLLLFLFLLKRNTEKTLHLVQLIFKPMPERLTHKILAMLQYFLKGFVGVGSWLNYSIIFLTSIFIWTCYVLVFVIGFAAFDFDLSWLAALVVLVITTISVVVPSSPGYVGTYHWLCQIALGLFGVSESPALAFAFVIHGANMIPFFILGVLLAWREGIHISKMSEYSESEPEPEFA